MASTILADNGASSGSAGIKTTADSTGALALQTSTTGGTATTAVTIDTSQNVGVGTTSPATPLDVVANSSALNLRLRGRSADSIGQMEFWNNAASTRYGYISSESTAMTLASVGALPIKFVTNGSQAMTLDASGRLFIGTTTLPAARQSTAIIQSQTGGAAAISLLGRSSDNLSDIYFLPNDGSGSSYASIEGGPTFLGFGVGNSERARISSSGNFGIGTTSPGEKLSIVGTGVTYSSLKGETTTLISVAGNSSCGFGTDAAVPLTFGTNNTERARIDSSGNLLVGTTTASGKFVSSTTATIAYSGYFVNNYTGDGVYSYANANNTTYKSIACSGSSGINFYVYSNGTYGTVSDQRLKKNIETTRDGYIDDVMKLRVVKYNWISDDDGTPKELGWIAQELEQVFPNLVQDSQPDENGDTRKEVKTSVLPFILLKAIQEQQAIIESFKSRLDAANL